MRAAPATDIEDHIALGKFVTNHFGPFVWGFRLDSEPWTQFLVASIGRNQGWATLVLVKWKRELVIANVEYAYRHLQVEAYCNKNFLSRSMYSRPDCCWEF